MQNLYLCLIFLVSLTLTMFGCTPITQSKSTATALSTQTKTPAFAPSLTPTATAILDTINGTFRNQIRILEKNMPRADSEEYVIPTARQQADFAKLVSMIQGGELRGAIPLAAENDFTLTYYVDKGDHSATSYLLREQRPIQKGWGLYAFRLDSTSNIIIEAPHPLYDKNTPSIALEIFRALDARALLIAGAHRKTNQDGSADVAHAPESIFQSVHEALAREIQAESGTPIILQIHGFHSSKHDGYPQTVIGFGRTMQPMESDLAMKLEQALSRQGVRAGLCTGEVWTDLCGTKNVQGASPDGIVFFHIELQETLRKNSDALVAALLQVFGQ